MEQLNRVKYLPVPEFRTLQDWEIQAYAAARSNGDANDSDPSKSLQSYNGTLMPFLGETKGTKHTDNSLYYLSSCGFKNSFCSAHNFF